MVKVVQLQFSKESAGSSALRLQNAFLEAGIDSNIISLLPDIIVSKDIKYLGNKSKVITKIDAKIRKFTNRNVITKMGLFTYPVLGNNVSKLDEVKSADVIYLHWVLGGFLNFRNIEKLAKLNKPIVVIMHDMWWITGGCHYSFSCNKYIIECFNCPMLTGEKKKDLSTKGFNKKLNLYSKYDNFYFISPSTWLYNCAKQTVLTKDKPVYYIPNVIDNKLYKPFEKKVAKKIFNINDTTVIAFGAVKVDNPYKGFSYLLDALEHLKKDENFKNAIVLIFGSGYNEKLAAAIPFRTIFLGFLRDDYSIIAAYNAADVFVVPSMADNQPTTIMESLCCGTPVVGFNVGGIPDMIEHKKNGYLAIYKDSQDIANGIKFCIEEKINGFILPQFDKANVVQKHKNLLETFSLLKKDSQ